MKNWPHTTLVLLFGLLLFSCRTMQKTSDSDVTSLTAQELQECKFTGKRFLLIVAPAAEFQTDVELIQDTFVRYQTGPIVDYSYFGEKFKNDRGKLEQCARYRAADDAKYDTFVVLTGNTATPRNLSAQLDRLSAAIKNYREQGGGADAEVQVLLAITSHGTNFDFSFTDGGIVLATDGGTAAGPKGHSTITFRDFVTQVSSKIMTTCDALVADCKVPRERRADEIVMFMDNCYSGNFTDQLQSVLTSLPGYGSLLTGDSGSKATRVLGFSAAARNQTATGGILGTDGGTLYHMMKEMLTSWNADVAPAPSGDGKLSFAEVWNYMSKTSYMRFAPQTRGLLIELLQDGICGPVEKRKKLAINFNSYKDYFEALFNDPEATLEIDTSIMGRYIPSLPNSSPSNDDGYPLPIMMSIQKPTMYSNLDQTMMDNFLMAIANPDRPYKTQQGQELYARLTDEHAIQAVRTDIVNFVRLMQRLKGVIDTFDGAGVIPADKMAIPEALMPTYREIAGRCPAGS